MFFRPEDPSHTLQFRVLRSKIQSKTHHSVVEIQDRSEFIHRPVKKISQCIPSAQPLRMQVYLLLTVSCKTLQAKGQCGPQCSALPTGIQVPVFAVQVSRQRQHHAVTFKVRQIKNSKQVFKTNSAALVHRPLTFAADSLIHSADLLIGGGLLRKPGQAHGTKLQNICQVLCLGPIDIFHFSLASPFRRSALQSGVFVPRRRFSPGDLVPTSDFIVLFYQISTRHTRHFSCSLLSLKTVKQA